MKKKQESGKCIFCNGPRLTKQHIWPDWLKKIIPRDTHTHTQSTTFKKFDHQNKILIVNPNLKINEGHPWTKKIRNVCFSCNNGWMKSFEDKVKPVLSKMIKGDSVEFDKNFQIDFGAWVVLVCTMAEYTDVKSKAISASHREILMKTMSVPPNWNIWIGKYIEGGEWNIRYRHHGINFIKNNLNYLCQISTFTVGNLFIHAISSNIDFDFENNLDYIKSNKLMQIWPSSSEKFICPPYESISDFNANYIADKLYDSILPK